MAACFFSFFFGPLGASPAGAIPPARQPPQGTRVPRYAASRTMKPIRTSSRISTSPLLPPRLVSGRGIVGAHESAIQSPRIHGFVIRSFRLRRGSRCGVLDLRPHPGDPTATSAFGAASKAVSRGRNRTEPTAIQGMSREYALAHTRDLDRVVIGSRMEPPWPVADMRCDGDSQAINQDAPCKPE